MSARVQPCMRRSHPILESARQALAHPHTTPTSNLVTTRTWLQATKTWPTDKTRLARTSKNSNDRNAREDRRREAQGDRRPLITRDPGCSGTHPFLARGQCGLARSPRIPTTPALHEGVVGMRGKTNVPARLRRLVLTYLTYLDLPGRSTTPPAAIPIASSRRTSYTLLES
jgi:hypothetical protein